MTRLESGLHASGQRASPIHVLVALVMVLENCKTLGLSHEPEGFLQDLPKYELVHPTRVDARGHFLSNFLPHHASRVQRREASEEPVDLDRVFYQFLHDGRHLKFNLTLNPKLVAPGFLTERRRGGLNGAQIHRSEASQCHYLGEVWEDITIRGSAAISTCDGLTGLFKLSDEEFFIQPLEKSSDETSGRQAHAIYRRHAVPTFQSPDIQPISGTQALNKTCGNKNSKHSFVQIERQREKWERRWQRKRRRIRQRSVSEEKWVETLVVADPKMVAHHGTKAVESYILAVMNIVAGLFKDASIGNEINIVVVRVILLEQDEDDLKITHHADNSLNSFCKWQKKLNMKGDEHPLHHDVAVLLTRKDICAASNTPCETLGLSHVAGMCQPHRSCSISEDTGLPMAFTVAHELGHNFGMQHDGSGNDCEPIGKRPFVMSPQLLYGTFLPRWSRCSRQYITRFLDRGWGWCLDDAPVKDRLSPALVLPGVLYSAVHQCRLQYGSGSLLCDEMDNVCSTLWCTMGTTCQSKLDGAVDGTSCGEDKWCIGGECVAVGFQPDRINGGWASWSEWSTCSRTCGAGVQRAERECDNPIPKNNGKYCLGERRRYRICITTPCLHELPTFRDIQCRRFDNLPYRGNFYKWEAVINKINPCELHCRALNEDFSEKMQDAVVDGTPCFEGNKSRNMCINGICESIGCDYVINSSAVEDRCGVCNGNGSTCTTVKRTFEDSEGLGYVDIGLIPEGAWDILIEEVAESGNFLALRSDNPNKYFLNGGWTIQWNGEYAAAGAVFTYERIGHLENLTSPGPTMEPLWIQLLFQESNPGVRYEYTISQNVSEESNSSVPATVYFWKYGSWTECSVTCGAGVQRQVVHCVEKTTGIVKEHLCDPSTQPSDNQTSCNKDPCPATWWVGDWQKCSSSCGNLGLAERTVVCIQAINAEEQKALEPSDCEHIPKPESMTACNTHIPCPPEWTTSSWSKCSLTCGSGVRHRNVTCSGNTGAGCDPKKKPSAAMTCHIQDCPPVADNFEGIEWSGSGWSSNEVLNEINPVPKVNAPPKYSSTRGQSRNHNDHHDNIEGDFHYHNNIENTEHSQDNNVQVDDFYYDYNFINFHEDLSDDFVTDDDNSENNQRFSSQKTNPTLSVENNAHTETTKAPIATSAAATGSNVSTMKPEEPQSTKADNKKGSSVKVNSENLNEFLSEDYLLPVSATQPPPLHTTHSQMVKKLESTFMPSLLFTTTHPTQDEKWRESEREAEKNHDDFIVDKSHSEDFSETPEHTAPSPSSETKTAVSIQDMIEYNSADPLDSPMSETGIQVDTEFHLGDNASEISEPTSQSTDFPVAFTKEDLEMDKDDADTPYTSSKSHLWVTNVDFITTSPPPTERSNPLLIPFLLDSGNKQPYIDSTSLTGIKIMPPTNLERATQSPAADFLTAPMEQIPTNPAFAKTTGNDPQSQPPAFDLTDLDYNEILISSMVRSSINSHPSRSHQTSTSTPSAALLSSTQAQHVDLATAAVPILPTHPWSVWPPPAPTAVQTSASTHVAGAAYWVAGKWSACSTSCGLGAIWRTLTCSTGSESDCDPAERPAPARQCYLRPCSTWKVGEWSKCSENCEGGFKIREVQCFDLRDERPLRPFHCRAMSSRPQTQMSCNLQPCLSWYASSWGQCSEVCGGGEQQRIVTCPEDDQCNRDLQPSNIQSCNNQPCAQWLTGSWGQCSASCGGGVQHRLIKCVNTKADTGEEVDQSQCDHELQPDSTQKCNLQECESSLPEARHDPTGENSDHSCSINLICTDQRQKQQRDICHHSALRTLRASYCSDSSCKDTAGDSQSSGNCLFVTHAGTVCLHDRLTLNFCQTLRLLGRCRLPNVQTPCCKTCSQRSRSRSTSGQQRNRFHKDTSASRNSTLHHQGH